ncbi:MAG: hypothetical protein KatS3mg060_2800 [Dehalococcoidia bacterium]|nr:MAG: hypothetical protein KatS3mg060_2800 [Dehalococcoidia bacterium]
MALIALLLLSVIAPSATAEGPDRLYLPTVAVQNGTGDARPLSTAVPRAVAKLGRPAPSQPAGTKLYGINLTGAEYTPRSLPGVLGKDYVYPYSGVTTSLYPSGYQGLSYFRSKGLRLVRLPVRWERVQPVAFGPLSEADVAGIRRVLDEAASRQQQVIVELHNSDGYYGVKLSAGQAGQFADVWQKLAGVLVGHPGLYGYELLNEPAELVGGSGTWKVLAQAGLEGIRRVDRSAWVLIPGYQWQKASTWRTYNEDLLLTDPSGKLLYAAHIYFDWDATGFHRYSYDAGGAYPMIGVDRVRGYLEWLAEHRVQGIITEYGVVDHDPRWLTVLENFLRVVDSDPWVVGAVAWAAGPLWGTPRDLGLDPLNGKDQPQMQVIVHFTGGAATPGVYRSIAPPREASFISVGFSRLIETACQAVGQPHERCVVRRAVFTGWSLLSAWVAHLPGTPLGATFN